MSCADTGNLFDTIDVTLTTATFHFYFVNTTSAALSGIFNVSIIDPGGAVMNQQDSFDLPPAENIEKIITFTGLNANTTYTIIDCWFTLDDLNCTDQYTMTNVGSFTTLAPPPPPPPPPSGPAPLILFIELIVFIYALLQILV